MTNVWSINKFPKYYYDKYECDLFMLPGLYCENGLLQIDGCTIGKLNFEDWLLIEKSQFTDDLEEYYVRKQDPFFCVFHSNEVLEGGEKHEERQKSRIVIADRIARTLRLFKEGIVLTPSHFIIYSRQGSLNLRSTQKYGRTAYSFNYSYSINTYEFGAIKNIYLLLMRLDDSHNHDHLVLAEYLFNESFDCVVNETTQAPLLLISALEAVSGTKKVVDLQSFKWSDGRINSFLNSYRRDRNIIAHGGNMPKNFSIILLQMLRELILHHLLLLPT